MTDKATETPQQATIRCVPAQQRSRERQERILAVATDLISSKGSDQVKMSEIAALSQISIGSLYQYFPDKSSIIRTLAERYNAESRRCIEQALGEVEDVQGLQAAYSTLLDQYYDIVLATPAMRDIWSGMQADTQLLELELQESRIAGDLLAQAMLRVTPGGFLDLAPGRSDDAAGGVVRARGRVQVGGVLQAHVTARNPRAGVPLTTKDRSRQDRPRSCCL